MCRPLALAVALTGVSIVFASACGTVTPQADASGQAGSGAGSSGQAGSGGGSGGAAAGTTGQAGSTAGTTGQGGAVAGTTGQAGTGTGPGGTTGVGGRGGQAGGVAGTIGSGGRGGQAGGASGGRGGTTGRGGQGGQNDGGVSCSELEAEYSKAVAEARMCNPEATGQCQMLVNTGLACPLCQVRVNDAGKANAIRTQWTKQGCTPPIVCPQVICVSPGAGVCSKSDASGSGGMCTMLPTPGPI